MSRGSVCGESFTIVTTPWNSRLRVRADDHSHRLDFLDTGVNWEHETRLLRDLVGPGMRVVDIGAAFGYMTCLLADAAGASGRVVAVEPSSENFALLVENVQRNQYRNVVPVQAAVADGVGTARLWLSRTNLGCHSLTRANVPACHHAEPVRTDTLDRIVDEHLGPGVVDLVKIDVEGAEDGVLRGGRLTLAAHTRRLWMEFWPDGLTAAGSSPSSLLCALRDWGYRMTAVDIVTDERMTDAEPQAILQWCERLRGTLTTDELQPILYLLGERS